MKDLFYNYDNCINKKDCAEVTERTNMTKTLSSDSTTKIVKDVKGNELGIQVKHNNAFTLYFSMSDYSDTTNFTELLSSSTFTFQILTTLHDVVINKELAADDIFIAALNAVAISISDTEAKELDIDSYRMKLTLTCQVIDEDSEEDTVTYKTLTYELYPEEAGLLIVR